jgi:hypothetical protein
MLQDDESTDISRATQMSPVRWAVVCSIALPLIVANCGWIANSEMRTGVTEMTISTLFIGVTFILFLVTLANLAMRRLAGQSRALNQAELMAVYAMLAISSSVAGIGNFGFLAPFLVRAFEDTGAHNPFTEFHHLLPYYIGPRDPTVVKAFFEGHSHLAATVILKAWAIPLAFWGFLFLVLMGTTLCLAVIVRQRWEEEEHLPFPIVALPLEMCREGAPLYRNRLMWLGFAIPCVIYSLDSFASIFPSLPSLPINAANDVGPLLPFPFNGVGSFILKINPAAIGIGYLIDTDVLFSLWFFYLVKKMENVIGVVAGLRDVTPGTMSDGTNQFPFTNYQAIGAWLALAVITVWGGREYYSAYLRRALRGGRADEDEPMSPRSSVIGFTVGFIVLCAMTTSAGVSLWVPVAFFAVYCLIMLGLSRLHAETSVISSLLLWLSPQSTIVGLFGATRLSQVDLSRIAVLSWFNNDYRAAAMPQQIESLVGFHRAKGRAAPLIGALMLAAVVAIVAAQAWDLNLYYTFGAATGKTNGFRINMGTAPWWSLSGWLRHPSPPNPLALPAAAVGFISTVVLGLLRARFLGFPLAAAGYVLNVTWANDLFWCDMLVVWMAKALILRYGGNKIYKGALPFFFGLILGDFITGAVWSLIGMICGLDLYRTFA